MGGGNHANRGRVRRRGAVALALVAALLVQAPAPAQLDTSRRDELASQVEEYETLLDARSREVQRIEEELARTSGNLEQRIAERDRTSNELAALRSRRQELQARIAELEEQLVATEEEVELIRADLDQLRVRISALLLNLHRQRTGRFARVLSQAQSFHDLQVKNHYLSLLSREDIEVVERLDAARADLLAAQSRLAEQLAAQEAAEAELRSNQAALESKEAELAGIIAELESTREGQLAQRQSLLEAQSRLERTLADLDRQLDDEIARLRAEEERLRRQAAQAYLAELERQRLREQADDLGERIENLTAPITAAPSGYVYPLAGHSIVSRYGEDNNSYMALRAPMANAAVVAVQDGVVRAVSYVSANDGYMLSIAHGDGLSSIYTNLRPPSLRVGDRVTKGQVIGHLGGSTLVPSDTLHLWVQLTENGRSAFVDPASALGF